MRNDIILRLKMCVVRCFLLLVNTLKNIHAIYYNFLSFYKVRIRAYNLVYKS